MMFKNLLANSIRKALGNIKASFDGATRGKRSGSFHQETENINDAIENDLETLRARSMGAYLNSPIANASFDQWVSDEIGGTATITATSSNEDANKVLNDLWKKHERFLDVTQHLPLVGVLSVQARERRVHGECFIRLIRRRHGALPVPMQVQIIKPHMCPQINKTLGNGNKIKQGIEFKGMKKVAVWFKRNENNEYDLIRVPMRDVIHSFVQKFAGQRRGLVSFAPSLLKEGEYNTYEENELNRKASQASIVGMITRTELEGDNDDLPGDNDDGGFDPESTTEPTDIDPTFVSFGPNKILVGEEGEGLTLNNSPDVGQNYKAYTTNNQRLVTTGNGVPMQLVTNNYEGINDRTLRQLKNNYRRKVKTESNLTTDFLTVAKIWRWFVDASVLAGADLPDYYANRDDYRQYRYSSEAFEHDHPVQDLTAAEKAIKVGTKSEKSFAEERGVDYEQTIKDKANHIALVKKFCEEAEITIEEYNRGI